MLIIDLNKVILILEKFNAVTLSLGAIIGNMNCTQGNCEDV